MIYKYLIKRKERERVDKKKTNKMNDEKERYSVREEKYKFLTRSLKGKLWRLSVVICRNKKKEGTFKTKKNLKLVPNNKKKIKKMRKRDSD